MIYRWAVVWLGVDMDDADELRLFPEVIADRFENIKYAEGFRQGYLEEFPNLPPQMVVVIQYVLEED